MISELVETQARGVGVIPIVEVFADGEARARALEGCIAWLSYSPILMLGVFIAGLFW